MNVYYLYKLGIYGHGVHGIWLAEDDALLGLATAASEDVDDYHEWQVFRCPVNVLSRMSARSTVPGALDETMGDLIATAVKGKIVKRIDV